MGIFKTIIKGDRVIWTIYLIIMTISMLEVFSASSTLTNSLHEYWRPFVRHFMFLMIGTAVVIGIHFIPPKFFRAIPVLFIPIAAILLIVTPFLGVKANEATRWLSIGGIQFQPSEFAKLAVIATIALLLSRMKDDKESINRTFKIILGITFLFCFLILPENFSTAGMLGLISFIMMFIGRIPIIKLAIITGIIGGILAVLLFVLAPVIPRDTPLLGRLPTWTERLSNHSEKITPETDLKIVFSDDNYQVSHSKIAIATGGVFGKFLGNSQERDFLPQAYSDFIYAIIIEETGLIGGTFVLSLYLILMFRAGILARRCSRSFYAFLLMGATLIIVLQALINMGVAVSLLPVTGQPLPLISRGGTSTIMTCVYFGIILSISRTTTKDDISEEDKEVVPPGVKLVNEKI